MLTFTTLGSERVNCFACPFVCLLQDSFWFHMPQMPPTDKISCAGYFF